MLSRKEGKHLRPEREGGRRARDQSTGELEVCDGSVTLTTGTFDDMTDKNNKFLLH